MPWSPERLAFIARFIETELGIVYPPEQYFQLENRLRQAASALELDSEQALWDLIRRGPTGAARDVILDLATNNETSFFRDAALFRVLADRVIPRLCAHSATPRILSAGCSSGQEAYSTAMVLEESRAPGSRNCRVLGVDISDRALARARTGVYSHLEVQRGLSALRLIRHFDRRIDGSWQVKPALRDRVSFEKRNLLESWQGLPQFDLIFFRNVLIYQNLEVRQIVLRRVRQHLSPSGLLVLGASESLVGVTDAFEQIWEDGVVLFRRRDAGRAAG